MKYFEYEYLTKDKTGQVEKGTGLYYTTANIEISEIINQTRKIVNNSDSNIEITVIKEIDVKTFIAKEGTNQVL